MLCHCCRIGKDHQKRLKLGRLVLPRALYKEHLRVLKLEISYDKSVRVRDWYRYFP
jgi:hypothetical protein